MAAIEVKGLAKCYGDVVAVDGVDITIESGEVPSIHQATPSHPAPGRSADADPARRRRNLNARRA